MSNVSIRAEHLSKFYRLGSRSNYKTLRDRLTNLASATLQKLQNRRSTTSEQSREDSIWALKDVSFEIASGEVIGIIGRNGAGKSTLLKILSRITEPTEGCAEIHGRVGSLLEVGTGFHPELTGRENIYLNGAILGMRKNEIVRRFDEIVAFAEVEKFLDTPVKHYSSGMYVRLAFAVAAHMEPEILLVDEVLAVGDAAFQKKCLGKMGNVAQEGRTVLFVSHNMGAINRLCQRVLWLEQGKLIEQGATDQMIARYLTSNTSNQGEMIWEQGIANPGITEIKIFSMRALSAEGVVTANLDVRKSFSIEIRYKIFQAIAYCRVGFLLSTFEGTLLFEAYDADDERNEGRREPGEYRVRCELPAHLLNPGRYIVSINAGIPNIKNLVFLEGVLALDVEDTGAVGSSMHTRRNGIIRPKLNWQLEEI
jgi:lipopolysaccharide transport system ATP-binding protein